MIFRCTFTLVMVWFGVVGETSPVSIKIIEI